MTLTAKRRRGLKTLGAIVLAITSIVILFSLWINGIGRKRQAAMEQDLAALKAEVSAMDAQRSGLRRRTEPGNAWDDYIKACKDAGTIQESNQLSKLVSRLEGADERIGQAILASHGSIADHLRRGATRRECRFPGPDYPRELRYLDDAANFSVLTARSLAQKGQTREAADVLFTLCQFAGDYGDTSVWNTEYHGLLKLNQGFDELRDLLLSNSMTKEVASVIEQRLLALDDTFPRHDRALLLQMASLVDAMLTSGSADRWDWRLATWRCGFSTPIAQAEAFQLWNRWFRRMAAAESSPYIRAMSEGLSIASEMESRRPKTVFWHLSGPPHDGFTGRETRARLRLLRMAAHYIATEELRELEDPLGTTLHHLRKEGRLILWSNGMDGADNAGNGNWELWAPAGSDLVLEIGK